MLLLIQDAQRVPSIFCAFGAITATQLDHWLRKNALVFPSDLIELWQETGGGDVFESETILRPTVSSVPSAAFVDDDIEDRNAAHSGHGKPSQFYISQEGTFLSAVRLLDQKCVTLTSGYLVKGCFDSFDEWYVRTLRAEFGKRYGLGPLAISD